MCTTVKWICMSGNDEYKSSQSEEQYTHIAQKNVQIMQTSVQKHYFFRNFNDNITFHFICDRPFVPEFQGCSSQQRLIAFFFPPIAPFRQINQSHFCSLRIELYSRWNMSTRQFICVF